MKHGIGTAAMILLAAAVGVSVGAQTDGSAVYKSKCQVCHGPDGTAATPIGQVMKIPSFRNQESVKSTDAAYSFIIRDGRGKMPAFREKLTPTQMKEVISYIRTMQK
ncbi:MAG: c-type cytochrome [Acidobacteriota bacterium]